MPRAGSWRRWPRCARRACSRSDAAGVSWRSGSRARPRRRSSRSISRRGWSSWRWSGGSTRGVADVQQLPFADGEFDCVVAAWMLYHVPGSRPGIRRGGARAAPRRPVCGGDELALPPDRDEGAGGRAARRYLSFSRESGRELLAPALRRGASGRTSTGSSSSRGGPRWRSTWSASITMSPFIANLPAVIDGAVRGAARELDLRGRDVIRPAELIQRKRDGGSSPPASSRSSSSAMRAARCPTTRWRRSAWRCTSRGCPRPRRSR